LINTLPSTMPSNRTSNDIDFVQPTQYNVQPNQVAKKPPPEPWELPDFEPLHINDFDNHSTPNLPPTLNRSDPFAIFSQFFTDKIVDKLVEWTNKYAELHLSDGKRLQARRWQPTYREELWAYFGVLIHIGLTHESSIEDYWGSLDTTGSEHITKRYMGRVRFEQLDRYFRCIELWPDDDPTPRSIFDRVDKLAEHIWLTCRKLYSPGMYLAVDETIKRFMGRAPKIVNIPSKPTPKGFKI
jgi:Transposase IS4